MKAEDSRQADTGEEESGQNPEGTLRGAETDVTTRLRTKAEWARTSGLMDVVCERGNLKLAYQRVVLTVSYFRRNPAAMNFLRIEQRKPGVILGFEFQA